LQNNRSEPSQILIDLHDLIPFRGFDWAGDFNDPADDLQALWPDMQIDQLLASEEIGKVKGVDRFRSAPVWVD